MDSNRIRTGLKALVCAAAMAVGPSHSMDHFDAGRLTIPMVKVGDTVFTNVITTVARLVSVEMGPPRASIDSYNLANGTLFIPAVSLFGQVYTNVTVELGLPDVKHVGGVFSSPAFVLVANPNDGSISSYPYGVQGTGQYTAAVSSAFDPNLANLQSGKDVRLYLDKTNGLLFSGVPLASGGASLTAYSINLSTGALAGIPGSSTWLPSSDGTVDVVNRQVIVAGSTGATLYPYDPATGKLQAANAVISTPILQTVFGYNPVDRMLFSANGSTLSTYLFSAETPQPQLAAQLASNIHNAGEAQDVTGLFDLSRKLVFVTDTLNSSTPTTLSSFAFSSASLVRMGTPVSTATSWTCGIDPNSRLVFLSPNNGQPTLNVFSYAQGGTLTATPSNFTPVWTGGNWGGCAEIDPVNRVAFFVSSQNPGAVTWYTYDTSSGSLTMAGTPAGAISITPGARWPTVISTQGNGMR